MSEFARIESIDALKTLRTFLCNFAKNISVAVDEADFDILDTINWLKLDRYPFWKNEVRLRNERFTRAKLELKRKQATERALGGHDSCIDELKAFTIAERRLEEAQEKLKKAQSWMLNLEKESFDCRSALQSLAGFIRIDLVNYRTQIDQMIYSLESYVNVSAPVPIAGMPVEQYSSDQQLSVTRPAESIRSLPGELEQLCRNLKNRKPLKSVADLPMANLISGPLKQLTIAKDILEILKANRTEIAPESQNEQAAFDEPLGVDDSIYFEHLAAPGPRPITCYIGHVEPEKPVRLSVCTIADLLKEYPAIKEILSLPPGWLILIEKNSVEAVFNADNKVVARRQLNNGPRTEQAR